MHDRFPLPDPDFEPLAPFWEGAQNDKLLFPFNTETEKFEWYPKGEPASYEWREVSGRGRLFSWVVVHHAFLPQYESALPFITALVSIEEDPAIRLATRLADIDPNKPDQLQPDMNLKVSYRVLKYAGVNDKDGEPLEIKAPFFRPASDKELLNELPNRKTQKLKGRRK